MINVAIALAVLSNTIFSFIFVCALCVLMYSNKLFLSVEYARSHLVPSIKKDLIPLILIEIML